MSNAVTGFAANLPIRGETTFFESFRRICGGDSAIGNGPPRAITFLMVALIFTGCANPGPPKPPSLHLPALVNDLSAERIGNRVILRWTTPSRTSDDLIVKGSMTAQICRETGPRPGIPAARPAVCAPVLRLVVSPGPSELVESLPQSLCSSLDVLLTYRVEILNSIERSAGNSRPAFAAGGNAPPPIDSFNVTASEHGAVLEWATAGKQASDEVEITRTGVSSPPVAPKPAKVAKTSGKRGKSAAPEHSRPPIPGQIHLRTPEPPAGTVDTTAKFGETYTYTAERLRAVSFGAQSLEIHSEPSSPVTIAMRDTFPPRIPSGLAAIPAEDNAAARYIDLSWEPNTEADLAGYFVYRQLARPNGDPQGPLARLTQSPVTTPAFRDVAVNAGQRYIYWVTAVDASGNESAPSAKAQETVTPERN